MVAFTFLPKNVMYTRKLEMGGNSKADGKLKLPWEEKLDKHTSIREMAKLCEIMVPLQLNKGVSNPPRVLLVEGFSGV